MSQRESGYERKERDLYETPAWVTDAVIPHLPAGEWGIWEPAAGSGKMVKALCLRGYSVTGTDIDEGKDFLLSEKPSHVYAIVTNPPYALADEFIDHALNLTRPQGYGFVAMLLRTDFDHAKTRRPYFADHPAFSKKVVLTRRIQWFEDSKGSPSFNHAWFIWDWQHSGPPTLAYGPSMSQAQCNKP
jgi:hypothetical protein